MNLTSVLLSNTGGVKVKYQELLARFEFCLKLKTVALFVSVVP